MKKIFWTAWAIWGLGLTVPVGSLAERPLVTEYAGTVEKGAVELELGADYSREDRGDKSFALSLQVGYGVTERLQISAGLPYGFPDAAGGGRSHGAGDLLAYLKYRVWGERDRFPAATLKPFLKIPTADADRGLGSGSPDIGLTAVLSESFVGFNLHLEGTYTFPGEKHETGRASFGLAGEFEIVKGFNWVAEIRYGNNFNSTRKDDPLWVLGGFRAEIAGAVFDAGMALGLNGAAPDYAFTAGVTLQFQ